MKWYNLVNFEKMEFHNRKKKHISTLARVNWFDIKCVNLVLNVTLKKLCFLCICRSLQLFCRIPQSLKFAILIMQKYMFLISFKCMYIHVFFFYYSGQQRHHFFFPYFIPGHLDHTLRALDVKNTHNLFYRLWNYPYS